MNLSLFALKLLMTPIYYRTKFKLLSIDVEALYYLALTYFPILIFIILSYLIQEPYALVSWANCYSYSLELLTLLTPLEMSFLLSLSFDVLSFSNAHRFPHKVFSFPQKELISCISQVPQIALFSYLYCSSYLFLFCIIYVHACLPHFTIQIMFA